MSAFSLPIIRLLMLHDKQKTHAVPCCTPCAEDLPYIRNVLHSKCSIGYNQLKQEFLAAHEGFHLLKLKAYKDSRSTRLKCPF